MQSVSSRIWTRVAVSISYDDNRNTTGKQMANAKLLELNSNRWNHLTVKKMSSGSFKKCYQQNVFTNMFNIYVYNGKIEWVLLCFKSRRKEDNSYRVEKESQQLKVGAECVAVDIASIELLILEQEWMLSRWCVVLVAVGEK